MRDKIRKQPVKSDKIRMRINVREIGFNTKAMQMLGNPPHLNFWWSEQERMILVSATNEMTDKSVEIPGKTYARDGAPKIRTQKLRHAILKIMGINENASVKLWGEYIPELSMIAFKTNSTDLKVNDHE